VKKLIIGLILVMLLVPVACAPSAPAPAPAPEPTSTDALEQQIADLERQVIKLEAELYNQGDASAELTKAYARIRELEATINRLESELAEPEPEQTPTSEPVIIKEWEGSGYKTTGPFKVESKPWVIAWAHNPEVIEGVSMGIFQIYVCDAQDGNLVSIAANSMEKGSDTSYIYETGTFYLEINAANTSWAVKVFAAK